MACLAIGAFIQVRHGWLRVHVHVQAACACAPAHQHGRRHSPRSPWCVFGAWPAACGQGAVCWQPEVAAPAHAGPEAQGAQLRIQGACACVQPLVGS
jgi:hypothetical protein